MPDPLRVFIGYDPRQPVSFTVLAQSIIANSTKPVSITPLVLETLPLERQGLTPFTFSRFLVPYLCAYEGWALFLDVDMMVRGDIAELFGMADERHDAMVSQNEIKFEWASAILFNCAKCTVLTPEFIEEAKALHNMGWADSVGDFPREWNHLVGYDNPRPDAKLVHFTQGVPHFTETRDTEYAEEWELIRRSSVSSVPWFALMGSSIHAKPVHDRLTAQINAQFSEGAKNG
jgi:hypothetical protein